MTNRRLARLLFFVLVSVLVASACGKDEPIGAASGGGSGGSAAADSGADRDAGGDTGADTSGEGDADAGRCAPLELGRPRFHFNVLGQLLGVRYPVEGSLGDGARPDYVLIELYDSTTETGDGGFLPPLASGSFDLAAPPDDEPAACQHCVALAVDVREGFDEGGFPVFEPARAYYARAGRMRLDEVHDPLSGMLENSALFGGIQGVELEEVDLSDPALPFETGGACFSIGAAEFDTRPTPGAACEDLDECGNELLEICDPETLRCAGESQCGLDEPCPGDAFCIFQSTLAANGACYPRCRPFASGVCPAGQVCVQYGLSERDGYCLRSGDREPGGACEVKDNVTGCRGDGVCLENTETCAPQCAYFSGTPSCSGDRACDVLGRCLSGGAGDPARVGETCGSGAELAAPCARNASRFDGICFGYDATQAFRCGKSCFVDDNDYNDGDADDGADDLDCTPQEFCALRFSSGLGICQPDPVCGDGQRGEVGEACDDGNTQNGDGCSADCQTVNYGVLCSAATSLPATGSVQGDTAAGVDGFMASCQAGTARARLYTVALPGPGQLALSLSSAKAQIVSVRSTCANAESELGCGESSASGTEASLLVQVTGARPAALVVLVSASTVLEEGAFSLRTAFTPQVCGDGLKVGAEVCDDGNATGNDGCGANCLSIEYAYLCANAETLPLSGSVSGQLGASWSVYTPSCGFGEGPDELYRITAPRAGTLTVSLDQSVGDTDFTDLALIALRTCGAPTTVEELGCSSVLGGSEVVTLDVTQGQTLFFVVDGLHQRTARYAISARLE